MNLKFKKEWSKFPWYLGLLGFNLNDHSLYQAQRRILGVIILIILFYCVILCRLVDIMILSGKSDSILETVKDNTITTKAEIIDRNGEILAIDLVTASLYANPKLISNAKEAAQKLAGVLPDVSYNKLYKRLASKRNFAWIARHISPRTQQSINNLGIPGIYLQKDHKRIYPHGALMSHVLGYCGVDRDGLAGVEKFFDKRLWKSQEPLQLSLDMRLQHVIHQCLKEAVTYYRALGGNAILMDLKTGEILSLVSLPDFDTNSPLKKDDPATFNRNTLGVYEPGSTFKILNTAIALESGKARLNSCYDARFPIKIGHFKITDFRGKGRILSLGEAFIYSSNIASTKIALEFGTNIQKEFLKKFGLFSSMGVELPEVGSPLIPARWQDVTTMTVSYGYGISTTPLHLLSTIGSIINGGTLLKPTLLRTKQPKQGKRIISSKTSHVIRALMRYVITEGTARKANIQGVGVFGKTGTAYKVQGKGYGLVKSRITSFVGGFPYHDPHYALLVMLDDPKATEESFGFAAAGWNAAPTAGLMIARLAPLLTIESNEDSEKEDKILCAIKTTLKN